MKTMRILKKNGIILSRNSGAEKYNNKVENNIMREVQQ